MNRAAYIAGLRQLADLLASCEFIPLPTDGAYVHIGIPFLGPGEHEGYSAAAALLPDGFTGMEDNGWLRLRGHLGGPDGLKVELITWSRPLCAQCRTELPGHACSCTVKPAVVGVGARGAA